MQRRQFLRAACAALAAPALPAARPPARIAVLSYNIRHGQGMDGRIDLPRTAAVIRSASPDVVALQEVDVRTRRAGGVDQASELARLTGMRAVFARAIDFEGGQYGNAVLARLPITASAVHPLPGEEPRALIEARLATAAGEFLFFATHLDVSRAETHRRASAERINTLVSAQDSAPAILAGDLNTVAGSETMRALAALWRTAGGERERPTIPVANPQRQIDWILYRPAARWREVEVRVLDEAAASDHRPILAVLELA